MLNEYLEFQSYVTEPRAEAPRIQPKYFTNSFGNACELNGLEHILTVIARGFLFSEEVQQIGWNACEPKGVLIVAAVEILQRWCGFDETVSKTRSQIYLVNKWLEKYPEADGWLKAYWQYHFDRLKKTKSEEDRDKLWSKYAEKWQESLNSNLDYRAKGITYKNVIANALENGKLRNRYMAFKKNSILSSVKEKDRFNYLFEVAEGAGKPQEKTIRKFLKNIAAYLVLRDQHPDGQTEVLLNKGRLFGWYGKEDTSGGLQSAWCLEQFEWRGKPIFSRVGNSLSYIKFKVDRELLKEFDVQLIDPGQSGDYEETHWVLQDKGHREPLETVNQLNK